MEQHRQRNVSAKRSLAQAFKTPGSIEALERICLRSANEIGKADERTSQMMLGRLSVLEDVRKAITGTEDE
jgi:hypothetical protein